jgi:predicted SAM-dependent methyltransferase
MKLHVGCGKRVLDGWVNCDVQHAAGAPRAPEILCDVRSIPLADGSADELMAIHLLEHFVRWECDAVIAEWRRLLKPGGLLVLELPDLLKCAQNLIALARKGGKPLQQMAMWGIFGDQTLCDHHMTHRWGWWPASLREFLVSSGFDDVREETPQWHAAGRDNRDMRLTARKV